MATGDRPLAEALPSAGEGPWVSRAWAAEALGVGRGRVDSMLRSGELVGEVDRDGAIWVSVASVRAAGGDMGS